MKNFVSDDFDIRPVTIATCEQVMGVYDSNHDFFMLTEGKPATLPSCKANITAMPPGFDPKNKFCLGLWKDEKCIAVLDYLVGYPSPDCLYIGLLLVHGEWHGLGIGHKIFIWLLKEYKHLKIVKVAVCAANLKGVQFWHKCGFFEVGKATARVGEQVMDVIMMEYHSNFS